MVRSCSNWSHTFEVMHDLKLCQLNSSINRDFFDHDTDSWLKSGRVSLRAKSEYHISLISVGISFKAKSSHLAQTHAGNDWDSRGTHLHHNSQEAKKLASSPWGKASNVSDFPDEQSTTHVPIHWWIESSGLLLRGQEVKEVTHHSVFINHKL